MLHFMEKNIKIHVILAFNIYLLFDSINFSLAKKRISFSFEMKTISCIK